MHGHGLLCFALVYALESLRLDAARVRTPRRGRPEERALPATVTNSSREAANSSREELTLDLAELKRAALQAHNRYRAAHDAGPLVWCDECYEEARKQANACQAAGHLFAGHLGEHNDQGQNLYVAPPAVLRVDRSTVARAVGSWYKEAERRKYRYNSNRVQRWTGEFTQLIWKSTRSVGMAWSDDGRYLVANYLPMGNQIGQFIDNVGPLNPERVREQSTTTTTIAALQVDEIHSVDVSATEWTDEVSLQFARCDGAGRFESTAELIRDAKDFLKRHRGNARIKISRVSNYSREQTSLRMNAKAENGDTTDEFSSSIPCVYDGPMDGFD